MNGFPIGMIILIIITILVYFGVAHRVLDRMKITDKAALIILVGIIIGSFIDIPIARGNIEVSINVGGALIPLGLAIYVFATAGTTKEKVRTLFAIIGTTAAIFFVNSYLMGDDPWQTGTDFIDPLYVYPIAAGLIAYIIGRSRRGAFIAAVTGVVLSDVINLFRLISTGTRGTVDFGGAGAFDGTILAGIIAVMLAEIIGETRERLQGGPESEGRPKELLEGLKSIEIDEVSKPAFKKQNDHIEGGKEDNE